MVLRFQVSAFGAYSGNGLLESGETRESHPIRERQTEIKNENNHGAQKAEYPTGHFFYC